MDEQTFPMPALTAAEVALVLAGLRLLQTFSDEHFHRLPPPLRAVLEDGGVEALSGETINDLCDRINRA